MAMQDLSLNIRRSIERYAAMYGFDEELIASIIDQESAGNPGAVSNAGATGLMQTVGDAPISDAMRVGLLKEKPDISTVDGQVQAGTAYLAYLRDFEKAPSLEHLLMMYNGGPKMKGAEPAADGAGLKQFVQQRYGGNFDGNQNASYRDAIIEKYAAVGGTADTAYAARATQQSTDMHSATAADTGTGLDSSVTASIADTTTDAQSTSLATGTDSVGRFSTGMQQDPDPTDTAENASYFDTAEESLRRSISTQRQSVQDFDKNVDNLPEAPNFSDVLENSISELEGYGERNRELVDRAYATLVQNDADRRNIGQALTERIDYDPLDPDSLLQGVLQDQARLQTRMRATQMAEQQLQDAPPGSAGYFRRLLFGNPYTFGRRALTSMSNDQRAIHNNTYATLTDQIKLARDINLQDPQITRDKLNADLRLSEIDKDIAIKRSELPIEVFEAQTNVVKNEISLISEQNRLRQGITDTELKLAEVGLDRVATKERAADRAMSREQAQVSLEQSRLSLETARTNSEINKIFKDSEIAAKRTKMEVESKEAKAKLAELERLEAQYADPDYVKNLTINDKTQLERNIVTARSDIAKQVEIDKQGANRAAITANVAQSNATVTDITEQRTSLQNQTIAWNDVLGNRKPDGTETPVPLNLPREDRLALELLATGGAAGNNPYTAIQTLGRLGATKPKGPTDIESTILQNTATAVMKRMRNMPELQDINAVEDMSGEQFNKALGDIVNRETAITNTANGLQNINGVLQSQLIAPYAPDARSRTFLKKQGEQFDQSVTYESKIAVADEYAKSQGMSSLTDRANFISSLFIASVKANNDLRGYQKMGLPLQRGHAVSVPIGFVAGLFQDDIKVRLNNGPEVERYLAMTQATRAVQAGDFDTFGLKNEAP